MSRVLPVLLVLLLQLGAGCIGVQLGEVPYRCGEGDRCPDGYECRPSDDGERYCVLPGEEPPGGGGGAGGGGAGGGGAGGAGD